MAKRNFIPLVPSGTINADASVAQLEQDVLAMDAKVGELAEDIGDTEQEINQLKSQISEVESGFPQKTASGSIVTIDDGADNVPVVSLEAEINPVQDLHGYDNPWPAGGGKNLINGEYTTNATGATSHNADGFVIPTTGSTVTCSGTASGTAMNVSNCAVNFKDSGGNQLFGIGPGQTKEVPDLSTATQVEIYTTATYANKAIKLQLEYGSSATSYAPYSNECHISGWTGANVSVTGKNLFDGTYKNWYITTDGSIYYPLNDANARTAICEIKGGEKYTVKRNGGNRFSIVESSAYPQVGAEHPVNNLFTNNNVTEATVTTSANAKYLLVYVTTSASGSPITSLQVERGTTATAYEDYVGKVVNISWSTEAGTVYGGSLTLNQDGTADITARLAGVDMGSLTWNRSTSWMGGPVLYSNSLVSEVVKPAPSVIADALCSMYQVVARSTLENNLTIKALAVNNDGLIVVRDSSYEDAAAFDTAVTGQTLVYELATPQTYHIENVDLVKTLYGLNNIWCDTGDIDLTYRADPATYTAEQIRIMLNAMVAPVEATTTASKAYNVNDFLIMNNVLYKVIANIANGGTITPNTNVSATTVGAELTAILNS